MKINIDNDFIDALNGIQKDDVEYQNLCEILSAEIKNKDNVINMVQENEYDTFMLIDDWRDNAAILGLVKYFEYYCYECKFDYNKFGDGIYYRQSDITEDRFLDFAENYFANDMSHLKAEELIDILDDNFDDDNIKLINELLTGNTILKSIFSKNKFDGNNKNQIIELIDSKRNEIIKQTFKNKKNLYANYCNPNLLFSESQPHCRILSYNLDENRKTKNAGYGFDKDAFKPTDYLEYDFIPFAFTNTFDAFFINNNQNIKILKKANKILTEVIKKEENENKNTKNLLLELIINSSDYIEYDVEVIIKKRNNDYYESLYISENAIRILKSIKSKYSKLNRFYKISDNNYINFQKEALNGILNNVLQDSNIELLLKDSISSERNYYYTIDTLIDINIRLKRKGVKIMKESVELAKETAENVSRYLRGQKKVNKIDAYQKRFIAALIAKDYDKFIELLLHLSSYTGIAFDFPYALFEDFEENKEIAYTFVNALTQHKKEDNQVEKEEQN